MRWEQQRTNHNNNNNKNGAYKAFTSKVSSLHTKAVHNRVMRYPSTLPGLQSNTWIFGRHVFLFFLPPPYYRSSIPGPSPKTHAILLPSCSWRRRFNNNNKSKQCCFKNQRWQNNTFSSESKQKSGHLVQFLSGELDSDWAGKHFYRWYHAGGRRSPWHG